MATINGTFNSLIGGTISGTVGTPGPQGPAGPAGSQGAPGAPGAGVPVGGTAGQVLAKVDGVDYNTEWIDQSAPDFISSVSAPLAVTSGNLTVNLAGYATETFVTSQGYITSAALSPYLLSSTAASTYQTIAGMAGYAQLSGATFTGNVFAPTPSPGTDSTRIATTEWVKDLDYAPLNSPQFNGNPRGPTPSLSDNDTSIATTAFVKGQGYLTSAPVTSVAGKTGAVSLVVGDVSGAAPLASPALTGNVTITTNSTSPALFVTQTGTGNILTLHDQASDTTFVAIDQNGKVNTIPSVTASAGFNIPHGSAPSAPVNGDIWTTTANLFARINGGTQTMATQNWVGSLYATINSVQGITYNQQGSFNGDFTINYFWNNFFLTVDQSGASWVTATMSPMQTGSKVIFRQAGSDPIVFNGANAFQNKTASAGVNAIVTAYYDGTNWYLQGDLAYVPSGYVYSSSCVYADGYDAAGTFWTGYWISEAVIANGSGGTTSSSSTNANGCWYPSGYVTYVSSQYSNQDLYWEVYDSSYNVAASGYSTYSYMYDAEIADGSGGTTFNSGNTWQAANGYMFTNGTYYDSNNFTNYAYEVYSDGGSGYYVNTYQI
jgi:hypothetical protein